MNVKENTKNLFCVKSILTILIAVAFSVLCFIYPNDLLDTMKTVVVAVVTFYFSHQVSKTISASN